MIELISLILKASGVIFLGIATIGLLRLDDPFQRMHAATKAGTLGAGLVLIGTMVTKGNTDAAITGSFALLFLILTIPVASHLLARAAYISGSELAGIGHDADALRGHIGRLSEPLEEKLDELRFEAPQATGFVRPATNIGAFLEPPSDDAELVAPQPAGSFVLDDINFAAERIRFAAIGAEAPAFASRISKLATRLSLPLTAVIAIDTKLADGVDCKGSAIRSYRDAVSTWMPQIKELAEKLPVPLDLHYEEGDAEALLCGDGDTRELLVLPTEGWVNHGVSAISSDHSWESEGLLRLADGHPGPVLYAHDVKPSGVAAVLYDGSEAVRNAIAFALENKVWLIDEMRIVGTLDEMSKQAISDLAYKQGIYVSFIDRKIIKGAQPAFYKTEVEDATAVILPSLLGPPRTYWYGHFWQDRVHIDWRGDVLVWT